MHQINKDPEDIVRFNSWASSKGLHTWDEFSSHSSRYYPIYDQLRDHIGIVEQRCLSAYTEKPLGSRTHIDHFRKRSMYPDFTFDYANLLVDDVNDNYGACYKDNRASVTKDAFEGPKRIFCPVTENMADFVSFTLDGTIMPKAGLSIIDLNRVTETIRVFNLNHNSLRDKRKEVISIVRQYVEFGMSEDEIRGCMENFGFPTLVNWILSQ